MEKCCFDVKMKREVCDDKHTALNENRSKVGLGVAGSAAYGNDSPLYGAMGFVRKSDRASGLTRKTKPPTGKREANQSRIRRRRSRNSR